MTYVDRRPRSQRYTGRGMDWARKPITARKARRIARYRIGLIIDAVISDDYRPDDLVQRYGPDGFETIRSHMSDLAKWLTDTGDPDGEPGRTGRKPS